VDPFRKFAVSWRWFIPGGLLWLLGGCAPGVQETGASVTVGGGLGEAAVAGAGVPRGAGAGAAPESTRLAEHAEFANWNQFGVGTRVERTRTVKNEHGAVTVVETYRLVDRSPARVSVESQSTVARPGEPLEVNPPQQFDFPAQFVVPVGMQVEQFGLPSLKAKSVGQESLDVLGVTYAATVYEWEDPAETGPITVRVWSSAEFPGRILRQAIRNGATTSLEEVTAVEIVEPAGDASPEHATAPGAG
jgi:hypothetical protein